MWSNKIKCIKDIEIFVKDNEYDVQCFSINNNELIQLKYFSNENKMSYVLATIKPTDGFKNRNKETKVILEKVHWHEQDWYQDEWFKKHFKIIWFEEEN